MHGQRSTKPNMHHCLLDVWKMLTELLVIARPDSDGDQDEINWEIITWARLELLGICHKCLRVLDLPHFAACLLNPGVGHIPDLNEFLP